jgi:4-hydroxybenzoate polyprenyltransferase/phosphoserine phosphatase
MRFPLMWEYYCVEPSGRCGEGNLLQRHTSQQARSVLVVDLDGTLIRSDMLLETLWSAFSRTWTTPFAVTRALWRGKAALKHCLVELSSVDVATLPYNDAVLNYIEAWRANGGRTALVTASNQRLAEAIAAHLGIFDEVYGSDETTNLKGPRKASLLEERFGHSGFVYIGDTAADFPVWEIAHKTVTANASKSLRTRVEALGREAEHLGFRPKSLAPYMQALRPHQWLKNTLVFVPMLAAHQLNLTTFGQSLLAFIAFNLVASSVYILNDLLDLRPDRAHPRKLARPLASGLIPIAHGSWMAPLLLLAGALIALTVGGAFALVILGYFIAATAYSLDLKRRLVIDICMLAGLYTLRILAGGAATGIPMSVWLLGFSAFCFLALAAVKRQAELVDSIASGEVKAHGRGYHVDDLPLVTNIAISAGYVSVLVMALYVNSPDVRDLYSNPYALWGICLVVLYWISRMVMIAHRGRMHDDPVVYAVKDRISRICFLLVLAFGVAGAVM